MFSQLIMFDELWELRLKVECLWKPIRHWTTFNPTGHSSQTVLHSHNALTRKLVKHDVRSVFTEFPAKDREILLKPKPKPVMNIKLMFFSGNSNSKILY